MTETPTRRAYPFEEFTDLEAAPIESNWTGEGAPPAIGERVHTSGFGPGTVTAYVVWSHELRARVDLDTTPDRPALPVVMQDGRAHLYATAHDLTPATAQDLAA